MSGDVAGDVTGSVAGDVAGDVAGLAAKLHNMTIIYALTRYTFAIQSRGHAASIKFNGQTFTAQLPPQNQTANQLGRTLGPLYRMWGANQWWQNVRLPYGAMLSSGDVDSFIVLLDEFLASEPLSQARTQAYFNHSGIFYTETSTRFAMYPPKDYANASWRGGLPTWLERNPFVRFDTGGDGGTLELALMVLDLYLYTTDEARLRRYMPLVRGALQFYMGRFPIPPSDDGEVRIFPTQSLETYWCDYPDQQPNGGPTLDPWPRPNASNCMANDHPTVAGLHVVLEKALALPHHLTTVSERGEWAAYLAKLPPVPMTIEAYVGPQGSALYQYQYVAPFASYNASSPLAKTRNSETPELYSTHPFRYFTLGRQLIGKRPIEPSLNCILRPPRQSCSQARCNIGWCQGLMNAALLGMTDKAAFDVLDRVDLATPPRGPSPYRFPTFSKPFFDYVPGVDHFANMNTAINLMLLQPADDVNGSALLFGAWPCEWDVEFQLRGPRNTTVAGLLQGGVLRHLTVTPPSRRPFVHVVNCTAPRHAEEV